MPALSLKKLILICALVTLTGIAMLLVLFLSEEIGIVQITLIALILLCWPVGILINHLLKNRQAKTDEGASTEAPKASGQLAPAREYQELSRSAEEAAQFLRSSNLGNREVSDALYGLPWYVVAGPPSSGKTSLALSAGLTFNALSSQRRSDQNLVRATRDCEWRITDNGVLIDTAGRYFTEGQDRDEWLGLIETLKKTRRNRALDGFVLTVNAANLLSAKEPEIEQQAQVLRARLDELIKSTGVRFPVYLVFTHADSIPGFKDFYAAMPPTERAQVWGATIPLEQANTAHALFDVEFDYLLDALMKRRLLRLSSAATASEQHGVFNFPLRFAETRRKLGLFTLALFRPNPFSELPLLRGFYFTSNPIGQDGRINDTGIFSEDFFKQVVFRDKDIAASFQSQKAAPNQLAKVKLAVGALAAICLLWFGGSVVSFFNNSSLLDEAQANGKTVLEFYEAGRGKATVETTQAEMDALDKLRGTLQKIEDNDQSFFGSLSHRFGLYSGGKIRERARQVYFDFVSQRFLIPALAALENDLGNITPAGEGEKLEAIQDDYYYKLQAYLMPEKQERVDSKFLEERLSPYWKEKASERGRQENLAFYSEQAALHEDDDTTVPRPIATDTAVKSARDKLKSYSPTKRVYNEVMRKINKLGPSVDLAKVLEGQEGTELLEESDPHPVPYAFTKQAYYKHVTGDAMASVKEDLSGKDDWVMGEKSAAQGVNVEQLRERYSTEYAAHWQKFLNGIHVRQFKDKIAAIDALGTLGQENSPLKKVVAYVASETKLSVPPTEGGALAWLKGLLASKTGINDPKIESSFSALHKFVEGDQPPISRYLAKFGEVREQLRTAPGTTWDEIAKVPKENRNWDKPANEVSDMVKTMELTPGSKAAGEFLARPLQNIGAGQKAGEANNLEEAWRNLARSAHQLEGRYPFNGSSTTDAQLTEFVQFFNPTDGELTKLYKNFLSGKVEGEPGQLKSKNPADFNDAAVAYLNQAFKLQQAFFPGGQQPKISYSLAVTPPPNKKVELKVDGTNATAEGSGSMYQLSWPSSGVEAGIKVMVTDKAAAQAVGQSVPPGQPVAGEVANHPGLWGLFRMTSGGKTQFTWGGATAKLTPPTNNPFAINFSTMRAPDNFK
ncbi:MAG: type VI secretion system membrane subunit TssM [Acidobacteria bacterium]|nr:type VI secretion system membrane subunit TssM [Acidobacteriota bacterium]